MAFCAPLEVLGVGAVALKPDSLSWVSPAVDAEQLALAAEAEEANWVTMEPKPRTEVRAAAAHPRAATRRRAFCLVIGTPPSVGRDAMAIPLVMSPPVKKRSSTGGRWALLQPMN